MPLAGKCQSLPLRHAARLRHSSARAPDPTLSGPEAQSSELLYELGIYLMVSDDGAASIVTWSNGAGPLALAGFVGAVAQPLVGIGEKLVGFSRIGLEAR